MLVSRGYESNGILLLNSLDTLYFELYICLLSNLLRNCPFIPVLMKAHNGFNSSFFSLCCCRVVTPSFLSPLCRWRRLWSEWERHGSISRYGVVAVWTDRSWRDPAERKNRHWWEDSRLPHPSARGGAGLPGSQVQTIRRGSRKWINRVHLFLLYLWQSINCGSVNKSQATCSLYLNTNLVELLSNRHFQKDKYKLT